jgi:hypothetical protein
MILIRPIEIPFNDLSAMDAVLIASNVPETDTNEDEWDASVTYSIGDIVTVLGTTQRRYESLANGNVGNNPTTSPLEWLDLGATNRWRMFDGGTSTLTTNAESIDVTIEAPTASLTALRCSTCQARKSASSLRLMASMIRFSTKRPSF